MKFKSNINIDGTQRNIHFYRVKKGLEDIFRVSVIDDEGTPHAFTMAKEADASQWHIVAQALPQWTTGAIPEISDAISEHVNNHPFQPKEQISPWNFIGD